MFRITHLGNDYVADPEESLLQSLLRQGAPARYSCGKGSCRSCLMRLDAGEVSYFAPAPDGIVQTGHVLPCICRPTQDVVLAEPDPAAISIEAEVFERRLLSEDLLELAIAPFQEFDYRPGQHVDLISPDGVARPYSLASVPGEDFCFRVHVRRIEGGQMSQWLFEQAQPGCRLQVRGPFGDCCWWPEMAQRPLRILATGSAGGTMFALARWALQQGHAAPVHFFHGARRVEDLYLQTALAELAAQYPQFHAACHASREAAAPPVRAGRIVEAAFARDADCGDEELFLCGNPDMVTQARAAAVRARIARERVHVDAFDSAHPRMPRDREKIESIRTDATLWAAWDEGRLLRRVLDAFYVEVFADARLAPFFQGFEPGYVASKQYSFLADVISGSKGFLGLNPHNAHHWMVISDELFDYREALFERVAREQGVADDALRQLMGLHELFRAEIVKAAPRGMVVNGVEQPVMTHTLEVLDIDTICDTCGEVITAGTPTRYQHRLGTLHCAACARLSH